MKKKKTTRFLALALSALLLSAMPFSAGAEEAVVKDFSYFASLDDYDVYTEFCEAYKTMGGGSGIVIEETIPENIEDMPAYQNFESIYLNYRYYEGYAFDFELWMNGDVAEEAWSSYESLYFGTEEEYWKSMEILGFSRDEERPLVEVSLTEGGSRYDLQSVTVSLDSTFLFESGTMDMIDLYRIYLTIYNSEFYRAYGTELYAAQYDGPASFILGDVDMNFEVNATDAAQVLMYAARGGCIGTETPADYGINEALADVNEDGELDASDASQILILAAEEGVQ